MHLNRFYRLLIIALFLQLGCSMGSGGSESETCGAGDPELPPMQRGNLSVSVKSNLSGAGCTTQLSGITSLQSSDLPEVQAAYIPGTLLNYEHILTGFPDGRAESGLTPRQGPFPMSPLGTGDGVTLTRSADDEPWKVSSVLTYQVVAPYYVDFEFNVEIHDPTLFHPDAVFFFASYMNAVESPEINFLGYPSAQAPVQWVSSHASPPDKGESYIHRDSVGEDYAADAPNLVRVNLKHQDLPRIAEPFFYGMSGGGSVYALMFDQMNEPETEIRFTVMRLNLPERPSPAWDFAWVIRAPQMGQTARLRGRLMFKAFVSRDEIKDAYDDWKAGLTP